MPHKFRLVLVITHKCSGRCPGGLSVSLADEEKQTCGQSPGLVALTFSILVILALIPWQAVPARAGFTPTPLPDTPVPTPVNTPVPPPPTNTPQPPPEKPPKDTPAPTATIGLTATPAVLPISGEQIAGERTPRALLLMAVAVIAVVIGVAARHSVRTRR